MPQVSTDAKLKVLRRELALRERNYPKWVEQERISQLEADWQIEVVKAIIEDYAKKQRDDV